MDNFGMLYHYELKKLSQRKLTWAVLLVLAAFMAYSAWPNHGPGGLNASLTDQNGDTISRHVSVQEQRELERQGGRRISGQAMDEAFFQKVREAAAGDGRYIIQERYDLDCYFYLVDSSYYEPFYMVADRHDMGVDPVSVTAEQFYQSRREIIERQWETEAETAYWEAMEARVEKPFTFCYTKGYQKILSDVFGLSNVIPLAVAVCLCGVFSEERRTRVDAVLFSCRKGRLPLCLTKVLAGLTAALAVTLLLVGVDAGIVLLTQGCDGFDGALQLGNLTSSLPLSMGQAVLIMLGLLILYGLLSGGATMLLSALTRNTIAALAGPVMLMMGQAWLRLDIQAAEYLPNQLFNVLPMLRNTHLVELFGVYLNNLQFGYILYGGLAAALTALCRLGWLRSAERCA